MHGMDTRAGSKRKELTLPPESEEELEPPTKRRRSLRNIRM
jgi:hypothetical protein